MAAFESDWFFLREALPLLRDYVLSRDVYWPMHSPSGMQVPQLTIGSIRLSIARLSALSLDDKAARELDDLKQRAQQVRDEWRTNWSNKAVREHESRLNLWRQYIHALHADSRGQAASYANSVRHRVALRLLQAEMLNGAPEAQVDELALVDQVLRSASRPGPFVWEPEVKASFPADDFWFLYVAV